MTLTFTLGGVKCWPAVEPPELMAAVAEALAQGAFPLPKAPALFPLWRKGEVYANATRIAGDATDAWDLTRAEIEGRRQITALIAWLRQNASGYERAYLLATPPQVGLRESRRLTGLYTLTKEDVLGYKRFEDGIALGAYGIDIHYPGKGSEMTLLEAGKSYGIPYRCLVPEHVDGLLCAGRCLSATHEALGSVRVMATCLATGHAAGVAAALAARRGCAPRDLDVAEIQSTLCQQGGVLA
jgi:succinate dehydrogenase/fumarate reductase flavoprotein subunit